LNRRGSACFISGLKSPSDKKISGGRLWAGALSFFGPYFVSAELGSVIEKWRKDSRAGYNFWSATTVSNNTNNTKSNKYMLY